MIKKLLLFLLSFFLFQNVYPQFFADDDNITKTKGYYNFYYSEEKDKIFIEIDQLDDEFLYVHSLSEGVGSNDIGLDRGKLGQGVIVKFVKAGNKLLLIQPNQKFRAITNNEEEKKSIEEAFAKSVLFGFDIEEEEDGKYLIDATNFFIRDAHGVSQVLARKNQGTYSLDKSRSAFNLKRTKAFEKNVEFDVLLTFKGMAKGSEIRSVTPNSSSVSVHQHHSFVELPDDNYKPRVFDPRCGSYPMSYMDYATPINESIVKRFVYRHRLEKKDAQAALSEAKEPIVYYLDRGTPEPVRSALLDGARWWNQAFEAIGYKDAFQVKMLPEGADPMDLRYNVIQWVHRSTRGWSYGGSISDPRTGEIIKGHVSLGSLRIRQDFLIAQALQAPYANNDSDDEFALEMALARIRQLSAHEVGHTLGFAHNFAASTNDRASVMDYPHPLLKVKDGSIDFSNAYANGIGAWDKVIVAYSYSDFSQDEKNSLNKILNSAFDRGLRYASDSDSRPSGSAHANGHLWDNGADIIAEFENVMEVRAFAINNFSIDNIKSDHPFSELEDIFVPLYFYHRYQTEAVVKLIGGLDYSYAVKNGNERVVEKIEAKTQAQALNALMKTIEVETLKISPSLLNLFPPRAIGYYRTRESFKSNLGPAFDPMGAVATSADLTFGLILNPQRMSRVFLQQSLDEKQLTLEEIFEVLISETFKKTYKDIYSQSLQDVINEQLLLNIFGLISNDNLYPQVKGISLNELKKLTLWLNADKKKEGQSLMNEYFVKMINEFLKNPQMKIERNIPDIPDGSPIGM